MANASPIMFLEGLARDFVTRVPLPPWLIDEIQRRLVLLLNHVLQQEPVATERLRPLQGASVLLTWQAFSLSLVVTPAGLLDLAPIERAPDLTLRVTSDSVVDLAQAAARGDKPAVLVEGDVRLAAELGWLVDHVRWDIEDDLARIVGDAQAHMLVQAARQIAAGVRGMLRSVAGRADRAP